MARETNVEIKDRASKIIKILMKTYPDAQCALTHENAFQLLVATMLSAQTTDARVNLVSPELFDTFKTPQDLAQGDVNEIEACIKSVNFFRNKAKNLKSMSQSLIAHHDGEVPRSIEELIELAGVGRKTANVVLGNIFDVPSMVVDTHVTRLSNRLGLVKGEDAVKIEADLVKIVVKKYWTLLAHLFISHGRAICVARSPKCTFCPVKILCPQIGVLNVKKIPPKLKK